MGRETKCFVSVASNMEVVCNHVGVLCTTLKLELVLFYVSITSLSTRLSNWGNYLLTLHIYVQCVLWKPLWVITLLTVIG